MKWNSPWGVGFPGWHLECSVMSSKYLGDNFDIHGGGMDLKFPHHECEIAQGVCMSGQKPVNYWMHGNMLTLNGKRMSKSTGNTILPNELFTGNSPHLSKGFSPSVVKFFMLQSHYAGVLDFSNEALLASEKGFKKLMQAKHLLEKIDVKSEDIDQTLEEKILLLCENCYSNMNDDFNTPKVIATLFDLVSLINTINQQNNWENLSSATMNKLKILFNEFIENIFGLDQDEHGDNAMTEDLINIVLKLREQAKNDKNYEISDQIRNQLINLGILIKDGKDGTTFTLK